MVDDSLHWSMKASIYWPDLLGQEVFCLPGTHNQDGWLLRVIQPYGYHSMLFIHMGTNENARCKPEQIRSDYMSLSVTVKGMGVQVVLSSIFLVMEIDPSRRRCILELNT